MLKDIIIVDTDTAFIERVLGLWAKHLTEYRLVIVSSVGAAFQGTTDSAVALAFVSIELPDFDDGNGAMIERAKALGVAHKIVAVYRDGDLAKSTIVDWYERVGQIQHLYKEFDECLIVDEIRTLLRRAAERLPIS